MFRHACCAIALACLAACDRAQTLEPSGPAAPAAQSSNQTLRGIVRHVFDADSGVDQWNLEVGDSYTIRLVGNLDQLAAYENREVTITGFIEDGAMVLEQVSGGPIINGGAEYSRRR